MRKLTEKEQLEKLTQEQRKRKIEEETQRKVENFYFSSFHKYFRRKY